MRQSRPSLGLFESNALLPAPRSDCETRPPQQPGDLCVGFAAQEPIFLPVQLVTGLAGETPVLKRVREAGDPMLVRMLIDLYGLVQIDAAGAVTQGNAQPLPIAIPDFVGDPQTGAIVRSAWNVE